MSMMSKFFYLSIFLFLFFFLIVVFFSFFVIENYTVLVEFELLSINSLNLNYILLFDKISLLFSMTVIMISILIFSYSKFYLGSSCSRFLWLTFFFVFYMMLMIYSPSCLGVIVGWDGLGLISYCLIIYYQSKDSFNSGFITAASNRLGDSMLLMGIIWFMMSGSFMPWEEGDGIKFLFIASLTKSAQFPFSAWLPLAMAAPTPISSLVHSSTLVTAGVYMLIRFNYLLLVSEWSMGLMILSFITIFIAGLGAMHEYDLKRVVALSTLGQLGFMMMILSLGFYYISFFHLLIHALFKALLFMCAGVVIHGGGSIQDLRKMGYMNCELSMKISLTVSCLCLMGLPFSSGFYSKDLLLEVIWMGWSGVSMGIFMYLVAFFTFFYSFQLLSYLNSSNSWLLWVEAEGGLIIPLLILCVMNIFGGSGLNWILLSNQNLICLSLSLKMVPISLLLISMFLKSLTIQSLYFNYFMNSLFFILSCTKNASWVSNLLLIQMKIFDQGWLEWGIFQVKLLFIQVSYLMKLMVFTYFYMNFLGLLCLMLLLV
uniref:NADH:ubiquinone reductase (H(+)-translocating) n=1 Tax=Agonoscena pistaciae TaxID=1635299 RepID=A0A8F2TE79_9HEMI|nr:NADH dehydrogenase subunit 5 [Agonoscena pistaciae]